VPARAVLQLIAMASTILALCRAQEERTELEADLQHLRRWRKTVAQVQSLTTEAAVIVIVTGFLGAVRMGIKAALGK
jgi:hypothetical protein